jgi:NADH:ubiquinone oxidoreductase subunit F (NADH-binding)
MAGPSPADGYEKLADHRGRLGERPVGGSWLLEVLAQSGLRGRGGAWFPTARKWSAVAEHSDGHAVVVVNGEEGEPLSAKDRVLLTLRPHVVLDGAALAAETLRADDIVLYLSRAATATEKVLQQAIKERARAGLHEPPIRIEKTAHRYIAGESSAVINRVSGGMAKPMFTLKRSAEKGVNDMPTLVQNAETIAHAAMIARYGAEWYRRLGSVSCPGTALMTLRGNVKRPGVYEVDLGATVGGVLDATGGTVTPPAGALLGGYFGAWLAPEMMRDMPLDSDRLRKEYKASFGCGILAVLPEGGCPIVESTRILSYLAAETAGQCGPCVNGLAALSETMERVAASQPEPEDYQRVMRWIDMVKGRGACHHPDGAVGQLTSALTVFKQHLTTHLQGHPCRGTSVPGFPRPPSPGDGWK